MKYRIAKITWIDSHELEGWRDPEIRPSDYDLRCVSVGYIMPSTADVVVVAPHVDIGGDKINHISGAMVIPRVAVLSDETIFESDTL